MGIYRDRSQIVVNKIQLLDRPHSMRTCIYNYILLTTDEVYSKLRKWVHGHVTMRRRQDFSEREKERKRELGGIFF